MRKSAAPRFVLLLILYAVIFIALVSFQFGKKNNFTLREGNLVIQGTYAAPPKQSSNTHPLTGSVSVFFGGMEFILGDGLELTGTSNGSVKTTPDLMSLADNEVSFRLKDGPELFFSTQYSGGSIELMIRTDFSHPALSPSEDSSASEDSFAETGEIPGKYSSLKIPYKAIKTSLVQERDRQLLVNADGINYVFSRSTQPRLSMGSGFVLLEAQNPIISYRVLPDKETAKPGDYIIPAALNNEEYEAAVALWLDQSYMLWNRAAAGGSEVNGDLLNAYLSEALKRGTYKAAAAAVSASWNPANSFYEAAPFEGRLETALRTLSATERERSGRIARLFNEKSVEFLKEFNIIEFLAIRGYDNFMDDAAGMLRSLDPAAMTAEQAAGILEGKLAWNRYRPGRYNPFDRFVDQALFVITGHLQKNSGDDIVFIFTGTNAGAEEADTELNLRLGKSLTQYNDDDTKVALGKTLILSVLSMADRTGAVPRKIRSNFIGERDRLDSPRIYRICFAGENYARAHAIGNGIWAWTAASNISGSFSAGRIELTADFPAGETHYMIIRGIKPFASLQFNGIIFNQNDQMERYDYSGWIYSASEQPLLVKIRHRLPAEKITIVY
jgi:hypothetical protein